VHKCGLHPLSRIESLAAELMMIAVIDDCY
jgi:hypothetical protein